MPKKFTIAEASRELGISINAVRKAIKKGRLVATKGKYVVERTIRRTLPILVSRKTDPYTQQLSRMGMRTGKSMEIIFAWIALSVIAGVIASQEGRDGLGFFFLSVLLTPLVGIIAALVASPNVKNVEARKLSSQENKKCPYCAEIVKAEATVCRLWSRTRTCKERNL